MSLFQNQSKPQQLQDPPQLKKQQGLGGQVEPLNIGGGGGGLFGNNNTKSDTTTTPGTGGGLFGGTSNNTTTPGGGTTGGGLFGNNTTTGDNKNTTTTTTGGGLFGNTTNTTTGTTGTGGGLFGNTTTTAGTGTGGGGLFGNTTTSSNTGTGGGLFGNQNKTTGTGGGLFGNTTTTTGTGGGLFGNTNSNNTGGGLFGNTGVQNNNQNQQQQLQLQQLQESQQVRYVQEFKAQQLKTNGLSLQYVKGIDKMDEFGKKFLWENYVRFSAKNHHFQKLTFNRMTRQNQLESPQESQQHIPYNSQNPMFTQQFNDEIKNYHKITDYDISTLEQQYKHEELKYQELLEFDIQVDFQGIKNTTLQQFQENTSSKSQEQQIEQDVISKKLMKVNQIVQNLKNGAPTPTPPQKNQAGQPQQLSEQEKTEQQLIQQKYKQHLGQMSYLLFGDDEINYNFLNFLLLKTSDFPQDPLQQQQAQQQPQQNTTTSLFGGGAQQNQQQQQPQQAQQKKYDPKYEFFRQLHGTFISLTKKLDKNKQKKTMQSIQKDEIQPTILDLFKFALENVQQVKNQYSLVRKSYSNVQGTVENFLSLRQLRDEIVYQYQKVESSQKIMTCSGQINQTLSLIVNKNLKKFVHDLIYIEQQTSSMIQQDKNSIQEYEEQIEVINNLLEYLKTLWGRQLQFIQLYRQKQGDIRQFAGLNAYDDIILNKQNQEVTYYKINDQEKSGLPVQLQEQVQQNLYVKHINHIQSYLLANQELQQQQNKNKKK